jgi:hypothetical protein
MYSKSLSRLDVRVLKPDHQPFSCFDISDVKLALFVADSNLLPICLKLVLPISAPLGFVFPPLVTVTSSFVRPVPKLLGTASGNQVRAAIWASALGVWDSVNSYPVV